jgi:dTDP-4-amino-4,6-dideoxygalactose transaminase
MNDQGIQCGTHYEHCHGKAAYKTSQTMLQTLPKSEVESTQTVSLPFHEQLSQEDIDKVISYVKKFR